MRKFGRRLPKFRMYGSRFLRFRKSLKTTNWQKTLGDARRKEMGGFEEKPKSPTVEIACEEYLKDAETRGLREPTLYKFRLLFRQLQAFAKDQGFVFVLDFDVNSVRAFRASWPNKNFAAKEKIGSYPRFLSVLQHIWPDQHESGLGPETEQNDRS